MLKMRQIEAKSKRLLQVMMSAFLKVAGALVAFFWQWISFRILGATIGGVVLVGQSQMRLLGQIGSFGRDRSLSFELAQHESAAAWSAIRRAQAASAVSILAISVSATIIYTFLGHTTSLLDTVFIVSGATTFGLLVNAAGAARGLRQPLLADFFFTVLPLSLAGAVFGIAWFLGAASATSAFIAIIIGQVICLTCLSVNAWTLAKSGNFPLKTKTICASKRKFEQLKIAVCTNISSMYPDLLVIIIGFSANSVSAAAFGISVRYIRLAKFLPISFLHVREPALAALWAEGQNDKVKLETQEIALGAFLTSLLVGMILICASSQLMSLFGKSFSQYALILQIVAASEIINSISLMCTSLLMISGHTSSLYKILLCTYGVGAASSFVCIAHFGGLGGAVALLVTNTVLSIVSACTCYARIRLRGDVISALSMLGSRLISPK